MSARKSGYSIDFRARKTFAEMGLTEATPAGRRRDNKEAPQGGLKGSAAPRSLLSRILRRKAPMIPTQAYYGAPYRWPDGSLFYTQGDGKTCPKCLCVWRTDTVKCPRCQQRLV